MPAIRSAEAQDIDLICYLYHGWAPRIRPASPRRDWMDASPESFAYRCLPLNIANAHGWELLSPFGFEAEWNGGPEVHDVMVRPDQPASGHRGPVALFGQGVLTFHVEGLFRTPPGWNLWASGPPNSAKDGIAPLSGIIETDWSPYTFTMNWRFTRPGQVIRFEEDEPFCFFFPIERGQVERTAPQFRPIDENPELQRQFEAWSASRDRFRAEVELRPPAKPSEKWQKLYYRGVDAYGGAGPPDHQTKLHTPPFAGAPASEEARCPVASRPTGTVEEAASAEKLAWLMSAIEAQRAISPGQIPRLTALGCEAFRDKHYAANWPAVLVGAAKGWPAVERWTPAYLKSLLGPVEVQVQTGRAGDEDYERRMPEHAVTMPFDAFIDQIATTPGNDTYLTAYNAAANAQALAPLQADLGFLDSFLDPQSDAPKGMLWVGPEGTFTPLHHDLTNNLLVQIVGRKEVLLVAPGETPKLYNDQHVYSRVRDLQRPDVLARFPKLDGLRVHRVMLSPGDALFIPIGWWHQVTSLDFSATITHINFLWPNDLHAGYPRD